MHVIVPTHVYVSIQNFSFREVHCDALPSKKIVLEPLPYVVRFISSNII
jgi:hypothetical protein